ncbi:MAG: aldehyde dehydrogenase family protein, partial [Neisseria sp.]|nr:aldehyde dehydrogenase family protein [Neisseria sp.]
MANAKTQIEVTVLDKASRALDKIKGKFAGLNNGKVGEAMAHITRATSQSSKILGAYAAASGVIAAGAGNPPVVVDETADLARAAQSIVKGASFDNNIICADEKVLIVVDSVADELMRLMESQHAVKLTEAQAEQLQPVLLKNIDERGKGTVSRDWVGRDAGKIAAAIGLNVPEQTRLLFVETSATHP